MKRSEHPNWPVGGGAMGDFIRTYDWSKTGLGPISIWPRSLVGAIDILLRLPMPALLLWGSEGVLIYNDSFAAFAGSHHPGLFGGRLFEGWPELGKLSANALHAGLAGRSQSYRDCAFTIRRNGRAESIRLNLDYAPVPDDACQPAGVLGIVCETTGNAQMIDTLRESEQRYRNLADCAPDAMLVSVDGRFAYANRAALQLLGMDKPEDILGRSPFELVLPEYSERVRERVKRVMAGATNTAVEVALRRQDGTTVCTEATSGPVTWKGRQAVQVLLRDIAQRKREAEAQRAVEARLATELEAMNLLYERSTRLLVSPDLKSALEEVLDAAIEMLGARMGCVYLSDPATQQLDIVAYRGFRAEFLDYFRSAGSDEASICARVMQRGERIVVKDVQTDPACVRQRRIAAEVGYRAVQATPLISHRGQPLGVLCTHFRRPRSPSVRDLRMLDLYAHQAIALIERMAAEERLRESEMRFRSALQIETVGVFFFDMDGNITDPNDAFLRMIGFSRDDEAAGQLRWDNLVPPERRKQMARAVKQFETSGHTSPREQECLRRDGSRWWALFTAKRIGTSEGVGYMLDITQHKRAVEALRESEARFRALAEASPALIWQLDCDGNAVYVNARHQDLAGTALEEWMGYGWRSLLHPDDAQDYEKAVRQAQLGRRRLQQRVRIKSAKGGWCWLESYALPWFDAEGKYAGHVGISIDVTEAVQLEMTQTTYRMATEGGNEGFYILRPIRDASGALADFEIVDSNHRGAEFLGHRREDLIGIKISSLYGDAVRFERPMSILRQAMDTGFYEGDLKVSAGSVVQLQWLHCKIVRSHGDLAVTVRDISEAKAHVDELERRSNEDVLTGLPNRYWVQTYLPQAIQRAEENKSKLALLFIDLDGFKAVNDAAGHAAGDELLRIAARRLKVAVRPQDKVARLGGDEFVIIIEHLIQKEDAAHVAERVLRAFRQNFTLSHGVHSVGTSIGISLYPSDGASAETLLHNADIAMYAVKTGGKHNYGFYDEKFFGTLRSRMEQEAELRQAVEQDQFIMYYQPRIDMATGAVSSMEALVRWQHPTKGLLEPLDFIPLAEESGLILRLGEMIIHKVSQQMACWSGREWNPVPVSINVSPRQFHETDLAKVLFQSLASHHIDPKLVEIELTESSMMRDSPEVANALSQIKNIGVKLLLDDFGTGYSSLSQLQRLDVNVLKVGRSFILGMERTEKGNVFFKAIITMSHALGMRVVAEGVENEWQLEMLKLLQCDEIQGFYVCRPLPAAEVEAVLSKWMRAGTRAGIRNACVAPRESERLASRDVDRM